MIVKALCGAALLLASSPAVPQTDAKEPTVPRVICRQEKGYTAGTAFRISAHLLMTAKHVISNPNCAIDGVPVKITYKSPTMDFAILSDDRDGESLKADCGGFVKGKAYLAVGHARALEQLIGINLVGTGEKSRDGASVLVGLYTVIPGQSGGPIIDTETGSVVGIINWYNMEDGYSGSIALADTPICQGKP